jgi:glycosyltransferase involved in cell wall biosynthesis
LEALACGLPAIYLVSGGHPEIVKEAGFGFQDQTEAPEYLDRLVAEYESRQAQIDLPPLAQVADQYLAVMKV